MTMCTECEREFPTDLIQPFISEVGSRPMCPICALRERNTIANLPLDTPFSGPVARGMYNAATVHLAKRGEKP